MDDNKEIRKKLKRMLTHKRYSHTLGVASTAQCLAMRYEYDIDRAYLAGLLHDCAKCVPDNEKPRECKKYKISLNNIEKENIFLIHAKLGEAYAKEIFGVKDSEILSAIRYHTFGRTEMTILEKVIFVADYIEPSRCSAPNLAAIRKAAFCNIDEAICMILRDTIAYFSGGNSPEIEQASIEILNYYENLSKGLM